MTQLFAQLQSVMVEMTRYPATLFTPEADFEEELGIDSVKLAEIYTVLQKRNLLPSDLKGDVATIRNLSDLMHQIESLNSTPAPPPSDPPAHSVEASQPSVEALLARMTEVPGRNSAPPATMTNSMPAQERRNGKHVLRETPTAGLSRADIVDVFTQATRYPAELFRDEAHLEEDLGIDSVKQAEIIAALGKRLGLAEEFFKDFQGLETVGQIVSRLLSQRKEGSPSTPASSRPKTPTTLPASESLSLLNRTADARPFAGKIALITGSGHGIGAAIARRLARLGAAVVVNSFHSRAQGDALVEELKDQGGQALHCWGSVANPDQLNGIFTAVQEHHGRLDFFIHSASNGLLAPLEAIQPQHWDKAFRTNIVGFHQGALQAARLMDPAKGGRMLALSSIGAQRTIEHFGCMGPVKAALESLVRYLAIHFKDRHIGVNALSIGPVAGDLLNKYPDSENLIPKWQQLTGGGELITEDEVADAAMFLLSPLSKRVSGSIHLLDGTLSLPV